jgi:hypothetical protein
VKRSFVLIALSLLVHVFGYYALFHRIEPFQYYFYLLSWWSYIVLIDALHSLRHGSFLILNRQLFLVISISSGFWCLFELINLRIQNWYYINLPADGVCRFAGYFFAYGTVIPGIYATTTLFENLFARARIKPICIHSYPFYAISGGILALVLLCAFPLYFFPVTWAFPALIIDGYNHRKGYHSFMRDLENGHIGSLLSAMASGLICGLLWETWNFWSISKWIYTVPFFEDLKVFEMPIPGYLGFCAFGVVTIDFVNLLKGIWPTRKYVYLAALMAFMISLVTFPLIDRFTRFSYTPVLEDLSFIDQKKLLLFKQEGIRTSYGIDPNLLDHKERVGLALLHLKGLGAEHLAKLHKEGIGTAEQLSGHNEQAVARILDETNLRRIRVYLKAAGTYRYE